MMNNDRWIPCEERLPEEKINPITLDGYAYPVTYKNGEVIDTRYYTFCDGHWYHGAGIMDKYVIAWMPLPKPYQPKKAKAEGSSMMQNPSDPGATFQGKSGGGLKPLGKKRERSVTPKRDDSYEFSQWECPICGDYIFEGDNYCSNCGVRMNWRKYIQ